MRAPVYLLLIEFGFALAVVVEKELALVAAEAPHAGNHAALDGHTRLLQRVTSTNYDEALFRLTGLRAVVGLADLDTYFSIVKPMKVDLTMNDLLKSIFSKTAQPENGFSPKSQSVRRDKS